MRVSCALLATLLAASCGGPEEFDPEDVDDGFVVEDGKEDNFLSLSAREYVVEGRARVVVESGAGLERAKKLISLKHVAIAWFLNQYLVEKDEEDTNADYGGFGAMVKTGSYEDLKVTQLNATTYEFTFAQIIAGRTNLMSKLPISNGQFTMEIGKPTNEEMAQLETNDEWYRKAPWDPWDPSKVAADKKESLTLSIRVENASNDAWWDYNRLFSDGKLTIDAHFGWDYHSAYHLKHSQAFYNWLKSKGFSSPVSSWSSYKRTSGPLKRTIKANGRTITVEVRIFYGKPGTATDPDTDAGGRVLEQDMRTSLATRDVIIFSGHSGPFYGFALANWKMTDEGDLDDSEMATASMPSDKYQIVLAEGCDTYMTGQAFMQNPNKMGQMVDVITTTSFSNAESPAAVQDFVSRLIERDSAGRHRPRTLKALLSDLDANSSYGFNTMYGVHGIDDNPNLHPYAQVGKLCTSCSANSDCGNVGNNCISIGGSRRCAAACTSDLGCPTGYACKSIASSSTSTIYAKMCVPRTNACPVQ